MQWTKVREKMGALIAIVVVIIMFAGLAVVMGWDIPVIRDIADAIGIQK